MEEERPKRKMREKKQEKFREKEQIPKLDPKTAQEILDRVFQACDWEKSHQTVEELEKKGCYLKKEKGCGRKHE